MRFKTYSSKQTVIQQRHNLVMKSSVVIFNLLFAVCAADIQFPAQWKASNSNTKMPLIFLRFLSLERVAAQLSMSEEKTAANKISDTLYTSHSFKTACIEEWIAISQRLAEMDVQIGALKKEVEILKTACYSATFPDNPVAGTEETFACEGKSAVIACSGGKGIIVDYANYGRTSSTICIYGDKIDVINNCYAASHTEMIGKLCNGQSSCIVRATNAFFGDTCPNVYKYLQIKFRCV